MTVSIQLIRIPEGESLVHREYYASDLPFVIGREFDCDLVLPDQDRKISRQHAELRLNDAGRIVVLDRSTNGTNVNGKDLWKGDESPLADGDRVKIGEYELLFGISKAAAAVNTPDAKPKNGAIPKKPFTLSGVNGFAKMDAADISETPAEEEADPADFTEGGVDLEADLLFDPFAEGPELKETAARATKPAIEVDPEDDARPMPFDSSTLDEQSSMPPRPVVRQTGWLVAPDREANEAAIESAVARLLELVDPAALESEYREYLGPFSRTGRRFWKIHKRMFARKRDSGEYVRLFKAILAEEIKKR
jgi:predicted component of type VI protein secretion system